MPAILANLRQTLPADDAIQAVQFETPLVRDMIAAGHIGRKGGGGFYRQALREGAKIREAIDLASGAYRPAVKPDLLIVDSIQTVYLPQMESTAGSVGQVLDLLARLPEEAGS